uniref:Adenylyltransferase and sulfurtransferase MOCS3 homolog n=2 Tax=Schistocephalus solidus TaxID=70667 RepID=A0A0V0J838_SCHSO
MEKCELSNGEIARYSRQLIIPEFGPHGQQKLADSRVLIVGCGGLGCPAAVYLAAAGVSRLTLVDDDVVEISNLHRQVMHSEEKVGTPKVESLAERLRSINHHVNITTHNVHLTNQNACEIIAGHDVVLDCTDNVATRYLLNDACAACGPIPLVSGSALRLDGQLTVYLTAQPPSRIAAAPDAPKRDRKGEDEGLMKRRTPCYRCIHPIPPPAASVQGCSDAGVIGVVPGIIGTMQAAETIKILTGIGESIAGRLFIMDMAKNTTRSVELRKPRPDCKTCAPSAQITPEIVKQTDYLEFCGAPNCDVPRQPNLAMGDTRITVEELKALRDNSTPHLLIDIRPSVEVEICRLKDCLYIPLPELYRDSNLTQICSHIRDAQPPNSTKPYPVILICRRGNKSHSTANLLASALEDMLSRANLQSNPDLFALANGSGDISVSIVVRDVAGGLQAWSEKIDPNFPHY